MLQGPQYSCHVQLCNLDCAKFSRKSKPFQAKIKGESRFYAEVKSQGKILALTTVAGGNMEECEMTPPCNKPSTI